MSRNGHLPEGWIKSSLGDTCEFWDSKRVPVNEQERAERLSVPGKNLYPYYGANGQVGWIDDYLFDEPIILLAEDGGYFGSSEKPIAYAVKHKCWVNNHAHVLKPMSKLDFDFCLYSIQIRPDVGSMIDGSTRAKLNQEVAASIPIYVPPLPEQRKIAEILGSVDENIEKTEALIAKLQDLKKATMQELLTKGIGHTKFKGSPIGKIPEEWDIKPLSSLASTILDGTHFTPTYVDSGIPFLRVTDIQSSNVDLSQVKRIPVEEHQTLIKRCKPERGDILCSKNGTIGIVKVVDWDWEFSIFVSLALIKPKNTTVSTQFLTRVLESPLILKQIRLRSKQGTVTNLHLEEIREFLIPIPPKDEQDKIVAALDAQDAYIAAKDACLTKLTNIKKALMQDLLTGKVRVKV